MHDGRWHLPTSIPPSRTQRPGPDTCAAFRHVSQHLPIWHATPFVAAGIAATDRMGPWIFQGRTNNLGKWREGVRVPINETERALGKTMGPLDLAVLDFVEEPAPAGRPAATGRVTGQNLESNPFRPHDVLRLVRHRDTPETLQTLGHTGSQASE